VRAGLLALVLAGSACATTSGTAARASKPSGLVKVTCAQPMATLWIDERYVGEIREAQAGVRVLAGDHRIEIRHDGMLTRYLEISVADGDDKTVDCELRAELPLHPLPVVDRD
jgi:hypothetical protein